MAVVTAVRRLIVDDVGNEGHCEQLGRAEPRLPRAKCYSFRRVLSQVVSRSCVDEL